jgi:hypothetical protein
MFNARECRVVSTCADDHATDADRRRGIRILIKTDNGLCFRARNSASVSEGELTDNSGEKE